MQLLLAEFYQSDDLPKAYEKTRQGKIDGHGEAFHLQRVQQKIQIRRQRFSPRETLRENQGEHVQVLRLRETFRNSNFSGSTFNESSQVLRLSLVRSIV